MPPTSKCSDQSKVDQNDDVTIGDSPQSGCTLVPGDEEMVVLSRVDKPPLRFKGLRLTHHWRRLSPDLTISVALWQQINKGFVISYSVLHRGKIGQRAIQITDLEEATDCLENVCTNISVPVTPAQDVSKMWEDLQLHLCFKQRFSMLVGSVLADWYQIPNLQEQA